MNEQEHRDYKKWISELRFYQEELRIFKKELNLLVEKHPDLLSVIEHVEEYENIFERKKKMISILLNQLQAKGKVFVNSATQNEELIWDYERIKNKQMKFIRKIELLKKNFKRFVAKNLY